MDELVPAYGSHAAPKSPTNNDPTNNDNNDTSETDLPPSYTRIDLNQTTFTVLGTFIHTPSGPAYQLSRALDQRHYNMFLRRLRPKEQPKALNTPLAFDYDAVLYEIIGGSTVKGHRGSCLPGILSIKVEGKTTYIERAPKANEKGLNILKITGGGFGMRRVLSKNSGGDWAEWKNTSDNVVAREIMRDAKNGCLVPTLEIDKDLDLAWREAILACWVAKLWAWFANEKTKYESGGLGKLLSPLTDRGRRIMKRDLDLRTC